MTEFHTLFASVLQPKKKKKWVADTMTNYVIKSQKVYTFGTKNGATKNRNVKKQVTEWILD